MSVEAVPRATAPTGATISAHCAPVQDDIVTGLNIGDTFANGVDETGCFVAEQIREFVVDGAFAVVQIRVAYTAGGDLHSHFARPWIGDQYVLD
jgi:hypothetical protein